jgi:N-acetylglucosaminyl-diphospho-decaprenol L-rhamnosyltransferase
VFVVIVNYRTGSLAVECLASLANDTPDLRGGRAIVVDNASGDDSVETIACAIGERGWSGWAEVIEMPRNGGFAYGNNAGIRRARELDAGFGVVVMLNPDAVAKRGLVQALSTFLDSHSDAGIAGASIENARGEPAAAAHFDPSPWRELAAGAQLALLESHPALVSRVGASADERPQRCDWVSGACMAIRREVLDAVGPLDEDFFLYFEEVDYCVRARRHGWTCWLLAAARITHVEGAATGIRRMRRRPSYWYESRRRFFVKSYGVLGLILADLLWAVGRTTLLLRRALRLGGRQSIAGEPARLTVDLLLGDMRALWQGELGRIPRHS